jgi:hypothetical protein
VGTYVDQLIVNDGTLDSAPVTVTITATAPPPPPPLNAGQLTLSGITNGLVTVTGTPGAGRAGTTVTLTNTRTGQKVTGTVQANGSFTLQIAAQGGDTLSLVNTDATGQSSPATTVTVGSGLPPEPATVAPALDRSVATNLATATAFLYTGSTPIQTGMAPGTIDPKRAAVLRGRDVRSCRQRWRRAHPQLRQVGLSPGSAPGQCSLAGLCPDAGRCPHPPGSAGHTHHPEPGCSPAGGAG